MKLAIVHDHLAQDGGAERVLKVIQDIYPTAPTFTLVYDRDRASAVFGQRDIRTSFLQKIPGSLKFYQAFLPLMPTAVESYDLSDYDVVLSSSSALAKGVITGPQTLHICYCHTPTRYLWSDTHEYVKELKYGALIRRLIPFLLTKMRLWDRLSADRVDLFIANSENVRRRIKKFYKRESLVIHPPIDTSKFYLSRPDNFFLTGGRLVYYKRFDLTVRAFNKLGIKLKIFGVGPEFANLRKLAKFNIEFLGSLSDESLARLYSECQAFIHPQEEDFGITPIEAMASGRPVIAYAAGGALETVVDGVSGRFIYEQTWEEIADAVIRFKSSDYQPALIQAQARKFDVAVFKTNLSQLVNQAWDKFRRNS